MEGNNNVPLCRFHNKYVSEYCLVCCKFVCSLCVECVKHQRFSLPLVNKGFESKHLAFGFQGCLDIFFGPKGIVVRNTHQWDNQFRVLVEGYEMSEENAIEHENNNILAMEPLYKSYKRLFRSNSGVFTSTFIQDINDTVKCLQPHEEFIKSCSQASQRWQQRIKSAVSSFSYILVSPCMSALECVLGANCLGEIPLVIVSPPDIPRGPTFGFREIMGFSAFPGVERAFGLARINNWNTSPLGERAMTSMPIRFHCALNPVGHYQRISVSPQGVISLFKFGEPVDKDYKCTGGGGSNTVQFLNMFTNKLAVVEVEGPSEIGFFDNSVLLITELFVLREASMTDVYHSASLEVFHQVGEILVGIGQTDTSTLNRTRKLYFKSDHNHLYIYDVDTKITHFSGFMEPLGGFISLTGLSGWFSAMFQRLSGIKSHSTVSVWDPFEMNQLAIPDNELLAFIPSSINPHDIGGGIFQSTNGLYIYGGEDRFWCGIPSKRMSTIVRLYKNIFLACLEGEDRLCLLKLDVV